MEVRTGTPPLLVLKSAVFPGQPVWVEWNSLVMSYHTMEYSLTLHGYEDITTIMLTDPVIGETVYSHEIADGTASDTVRDLKADHDYTVTVASPAQTYLSATVHTEAPDVSIDELSCKGNVIEYKVTVGTDVPLTLKVIDPDTGKEEFTKDLTLGENTGTVRDLRFMHEYTVAVYDGEDVCVSESVKTEILSTVKAAASGQKVLAAVDVNSLDNVTVGLYTDRECKIPVREEKAAERTGLYTYDVTGAGTYYMGVRDKFGYLESLAVDVSGND